MGLVARLTGPFRLETQSGTDLTPSSSKGCGLLLLLLTSPNGSRERRWLQDKLWSDRGKDQGAGSLRQAVYQCKNALGSYGKLLTSTKLRVSLDLTHIAIDTSDRGEFAEGLDARDQAFEEWLTVERSSVQQARDFETPPKVVHDTLRAQPSVTLAIATAVAQDTMTGWFTEVVADQCATTLSEIIGANVLGPSSPVQFEPEFQLLLGTVLGEDGAIYLRARLNEAPFGFQVWSSHRIVTSLLGGPAQDPDVLQMVVEIAETIRKRLSQRPAETAPFPSLLGSKAIGRMFSMTEEGAADADELLSTAFDADPRATYLAWQSQVRIIQSVEKYSAGTSEFREESRDLTARALELDCNDSMVLALAANSAQYLEGRSDQALAHALRAVEVNPSNPFAWWTLASAQLYTNEPEQAFASAAKSRDLLKGSTLQFLPESILGGSAIAMGNHSLALRHFERSLTFRPTFKPSLRYAIGLNAKYGNMERARMLVAALMRHEKDFNPDQLLRDGTYPSSLLRLDETLDIQIFRDLA